MSKHLIQDVGGGFGRRAKENLEEVRFRARQLEIAARQRVSIALARRLRRKRGGERRRRPAAAATEESVCSARSR